MTCRAERDLVGRNRSAVRLHAPNAVPLEVKSDDLAVLDQIDAHLVRFAGEGPGDVIVLRDAAPSLQRPADDGVAHIQRGVDDRAKRFDLIDGEPLGIDPVEPIGVDAPHRFAAVAEAVHQAEDAALAEEDVVIELLPERFPQLERVLVDGGALVPEVVGADHGRIPGHVATGQPAPFEDGHVRDPFIPGEVIGGGEAGTTAAHDDDVVDALRFRIAPEPVGARVWFSHPRRAHIYKGMAEAAPDWWQTGFGPEYLALYDAFLAERTPVEVDQIEALLQLHPLRRILDLPCGQGRH